MDLLASDIMLKAFTEKVASEFGNEKSAVSKADIARKVKGGLRKLRNVAQRFTASGRARTQEAARLRSARGTARIKAGLEGLEAGEAKYRSLNKQKPWGPMPAVEREKIIREEASKAVRKNRSKAYKREMQRIPKSTNPPKKSYKPLATAVGVPAAATATYQRGKAQGKYEERKKNR